MYLSLSDTIGYCQCGDRLVLLDLEADRYFSLTGAAAATVIALGAGPLSSDLPPVAGLHARGWLVPVADIPANRPRAAAVAPMRDALAGHNVTARCSDIARAAWLQLRTTRALRRRRLIDIIADIGIDSLPPGPITPAACTKARMIAAAFGSSALVIGSADRCLARAIALVVMARRAGIRPTLVFGVSADPFAAHCWVQLDDIVLTGDLDTARQFTPILALS